MHFLFCNDELTLECFDRKDLLLYILTAHPKRLKSFCDTRWRDHFLIANISVKLHKKSTFQLRQAFISKYHSSNASFQTGPYEGRQNLQRYNENHISQFILSVLL